MKCPYCNQEHPDDFLYCPTTGDKIGKLKACTNPSCPDYGKHILPWDSMYCPQCGDKIDGMIQLESTKVRNLSPEIEDHRIDNVGETKLFTCSICGYVYNGIVAPGNCPRCFTPKWTFGTSQVLIPKYKCCVCGYIYEGKQAPEKCPICKAPSIKFKAL